MNFNLQAAPPETVSIALFGSHARADATPDSDVDVLVVASDASTRPRSEIMTNAHDLALFSIEPTVFFSSEIQQMAKNASMLLWHIKLEAKILLDHNDLLASALDHLAMPSNLPERLKPFKNIIRDISLSRHSKYDMTTADLHALANSCRNICMILCFLQGEPKFSWSSCYRQASVIPGFPLAFDTYSALHDASLCYSRGSCLPIEPADSFISAALDLVYFAETVTHA